MSPGRAWPDPIVVSGGQTGVDRAALDAALVLGLSYAGWCPAGGWAEDHPDPPGLLGAYPLLRESPSSDPAERTAWNVRDSDALLVVTPPDQDSPGTRLTLEVARRLGRPTLIVAPDADPGDVSRWLAALGADTRLDVAGPRESGVPGLYERTRRLLERAWS